MHSRLCPMSDSWPSALQCMRSTCAACTLRITVQNVPATGERAGGPETTMVRKERLGPVTRTIEVWMDGICSDASRASRGGKAPKEAPGVPRGGRVLDALAQLPDSVPYIANDLQMGKVHRVYHRTEVVHMYYLHRNSSGCVRQAILSQSTACSASAFTQALM